MSRSHFRLNRVFTALATILATACAGGECPDGFTKVGKVCRRDDASIADDAAGPVTLEAGQEPAITNGDGGTAGEGTNAHTDAATDDANIAAMDTGVAASAGTSSDAGSADAGAIDAGVADASTTTQDSGGSGPVDAAKDAVVSCSAGYELKNGACQDIDECFAGTHGCHMTSACNNTPGGYDCTCPLGYSGGTSSGFACAPRIAVGKSPTASAVHACVLLLDGSVRCWGGNGVGQLGDGTQTDRFDPVVVPGLNDVVLLSAGDRSTCAVLRGGTAKCWGDNASGQLGKGDSMSALSPTPVSLLQGIVSIDVARAHACVALRDGSVKCWGDNQKGQLGDSSASATSTSAVGVRGVSQAASVFAGNDQTCAILVTGELKCWGSGALGAASGLTTSATPVAIAVPNNPIAVAIGGFHACSVHRSGGAQCWGTPALLGSGSASRDGSPGEVLGVGIATNAAIMLYDTYVLSKTGELSTWGSTPAPVQGFAPGSVVSAGILKLCQIARDGTVACLTNSGIAQVAGLDLW